MNVYRSAHACSWAKDPPIKAILPQDCHVGITWKLSSRPRHKCQWCGGVRRNTLNLKLHWCKLPACREQDSRPGRMRATWRTGSPSSAGQGVPAGAYGWDDRRGRGAGAAPAGASGLANAVFHPGAGVVHRPGYEQGQRAAWREQDNEELADRDARHTPVGRAVRRPGNRTKRARIGKASGYTHRSFRPDPVRYLSVTTAMRRSTVTQFDTWRDKKETARRAAFSQLAGRFRWWWQVLGSNQRRLSRRFYRPLPLATRATCRIPLAPGGIARIAQDAAWRLPDWRDRTLPGRQAHGWRVPRDGPGRRV